MWGGVVVLNPQSCMESGDEQPRRHTMLFEVRFLFVIIKYWLFLVHFLQSY